MSEHYYATGSGASNNMWTYVQQPSPQQREDALRSEALRLAVCDEPAESVVYRAEAYLAFLKGEKA